MAAFRRMATLRRVRDGTANRDDEREGVIIGEGAAGSLTLFLRRAFELERKGEELVANHRHEGA